MKGIDLLMMLLADGSSAPPFVLQDDFSIGALGAHIDGREAQIGGAGNAWRRIYGLEYGYSDVNYLRAGSGLRREDWAGSVWEAVVLNLDTSLPDDGWEIELAFSYNPNTTTRVEVVVLGNVCQLVALGSIPHASPQSRIDGHYCYMRLDPTFRQGEVGGWWGYTQVGTYQSGDYRSGTHILKFRKKDGVITLDLDSGSYVVSTAAGSIGAGDGKNNIGFAMKTDDDLERVELLHIKARLV